LLIQSEIVSTASFSMPMMAVAVAEIVLRRVPKIQTGAVLWVFTKPSTLCMSVKWVFLMWLVVAEVHLNPNTPKNKEPKPNLKAD
jgi:hypothetical protein